MLNWHSTRSPRCQVGRTSRALPMRQRQGGWEILTTGKGQPMKAATYVERAVWNDPLNGNCWQDLSRVYGRAVGLPVR